MNYPTKAALVVVMPRIGVEVLNFHNDEEKEEWRSQQDSWRASVPMHGAFLGTFRFVGLYKKVLYTTV